MSGAATPARMPADRATIGAAGRGKLPTPSDTRGAGTAALAAIGATSSSRARATRAVVVPLGSNTGSSTPLPRRRAPLRADDGATELRELAARGLARLEQRRREAAQRQAASAVPSSLDTSGTSGTHPPASDPYAETPDAFAFRRQVAARLKSRWPSRAKSLKNCGRAGALLACKGCRGLTAVPYRCGARTCPTCARLASAVLGERLRRMAVEVGRLCSARPFGNRASWDPAVHYTCPKHAPNDAGEPACECWRERYWSLVTLTTWAGDHAARWTPEELELRARTVRSAFRIFWRSTEWGRQVNKRVPLHAPASRWPREWSGLTSREVKGERIGDRRVKRSRADTACTMSVEVSPTGMVHVHVLVYGEFTLKSHLAELWADAVRDAYGPREWWPDAPELQRDRLVIDVRRVVGKRAAASEQVALADAIAEVVKYATKGSLGLDGREHMPSPRKAAAVELALRGLRRVEYGGAFRIVARAWSDDVSRKALAAEQAKECAGCGCVGAWKHLRCARPSEIRAAGGFGHYPTLSTLAEPPPCHAIAS